MTVSSACRGLAGRLAGILVSLVCQSAAGCSASAPPHADGDARGRIVSVADGDTVTVRLDSGATRRVRLLSLDSPEKYATRYGSPDECGALAASAFMSRFDRRAVVLVRDPGQEDMDDYGRLLRYVDLPGGTDIGAAEVARGLAMPYVFDTPARREARYRRLAGLARSVGRGTWAPPCDGDFHSSLPGIQDGL
jgi:micrococcal nuclease